MVLVKITAKIPPKRPQVAKFQSAPKQFLEIALKRAGAGQSFKTNPDFLFFKSAKAPMPHHAGAQLSR
jgi:hypothetical protein